jgi:hypothetical protein
MMPVPTRAADVDGALGTLHRDHAGAHGQSSACDLAGGFAPVGQVREEGGDGLGMALAVEDGAEDRLGLILREGRERNGGRVPCERVLMPRGSG